MKAEREIRPEPTVIDSDNMNSRFNQIACRLHLFIRIPIFNLENMAGDKETLLGMGFDSTRVECS